MIQKRCTICKRLYYASRSDSKTCTPRCRTKKSRKKKGYSNSKGIKKVCPICGKIFEASNANHKYCWSSDKSSSCRTMAYYIRKFRKMQSQIPHCPICEDDLLMVSYIRDKVYCIICRYTTTEQQMIDFFVQLRNLERITASYGHVKL